MGLGLLLVTSVGGFPENDRAGDVLAVRPGEYPEQAGSPNERGRVADKTWTEEVEIAHYKQPCETLVTGFCLVSRRNAAQPWRIHGWIKGFTPTWGETARLRVRVRQIANPPADGSSVEYRIAKVLSTTPVPPGTEFELVFAPGWAQELIVGEPNALSLKGERSLVCTDSAICAELEARRRSLDRGIRLMLRHPSKPGDPLLVVGISDWP